jgi:hypothetical protein
MIENANSNTQKKFVENQLVGIQVVQKDTQDPVEISFSRSIVGLVKIANMITSLVVKFVLEKEIKKTNR